MNIERIILQGCGSCKQFTVILKLPQPISHDLLQALIRYGMNELKHFTNVGILYVENAQFILSGPIGSDKLQFKCKKGNCDEQLNNVEAFINGIQNISPNK